MPHLDQVIEPGSFAENGIRQGATIHATVCANLDPAPEFDEAELGGCLEPPLTGDIEAEAFLSDRKSVV